MRKVIRLVAKDLPKILVTTSTPTLRPEPLWLSKLKPEYTQEELNKKYISPAEAIAQSNPSIEGSW